MAFLERHIFTAPPWLLPDYLSELLPSSRLAIMENLQSSAIKGLVNENVLVRMLRAEEQLGPGTYKPEEFFMDMNRSVFWQLRADRYLPQEPAEHLCQYTVQDDRTGRTTLGQCRPCGHDAQNGASIENNDVKALVAAELESIAKLKRGL